MAIMAKLINAHIELLQWRGYRQFSHVSDVHACICGFVAIQVTSMSRAFPFTFRHCMILSFWLMFPSLRSRLEMKGKLNEQTLYIAHHGSLHLPLSSSLFGIAVAFASH